MNITNRFAIVLIGSISDSIYIKVLDFIKDLFTSPTYLKGNLYDIKMEFGNLKQSDDALKKMLAIIDISKSQEFKHLDNVNGIVLEDNWLVNKHIQNILIPNIRFKTQVDESKNYSHTIWLATSREEVPKILSTNTHCTFIVDNKNLDTIFKGKFNLENIALITADRKVINIPRLRFL